MKKGVLSRRTLSLELKYIVDCYNKHEYRRALKYAKKLIKLYPDSDRLMAWLARLYMYCGCLKKAEEIVFHLIDVFPMNEIIYDAVGHCAVDTIKICQQEINKKNIKLPISLSYRRKFLNNPEKALKKWYESKFYKIITHTVKHQKKNTRPEKENRKTKKNILFISNKNWNFLNVMINYLKKESDINIKTLEFSHLSDHIRLNYYKFIGRIIVHSYLNKPMTFFKSHDLKEFNTLSDWADIIFIEWCLYPAVWVSWLGLRNKKIVVRLHSNEAFTFFPYCVNWQNISSLITVSSHIQTFLSKQIDLVKYRGLKLLSIPNVNELKKFKLPKKKCAEKRLALIGYNNLNKNPILALKILKKLRQKDKTWQILFVGHPWQENSSNTYEKKYYLKYKQFIRKHKLEKAIEEYGFTDKVEQAITKIGYILSTSDRESMHESVLQSMASGSIPIIRDWPVCRNYMKENLYNERWIFKNANEAVKMILKIDQTGQFKKYSAMAQKEAFKKFDYSKTMDPILKEIS